MLAAPALGADTAAVTATLFGAPLAALRVVAAALAAAAAAAVVATRRAAPGAPPPPWDLLHGGAWHRVSTALDELVTHAAPWMIAGVVGAALLATALPPDALAGPAPAVAAALILAATSYVCAAAAVPVAAALVAAGMPVGAALAGLALAPAIHPPTVALLGREAGAGRAALAVVVAAAVAGGLWAVAGAVGARPLPAAPRAIGDGCLLVLAALGLRSLWRAGAASWVAALHGHGAHGGHHDERHGGGEAAHAPHADHHAPDFLHEHEHEHDGHGHGHHDRAPD